MDFSLFFAIFPWVLLGSLLIIIVLLLRCFCFRGNNFWLQPSPPATCSPVDEEDETQLLTTPITAFRNDKSFDVIIVGSGISGLSAASFILQSNPNQKVLILEQNEQLGGMTHTFTEDGYEFSPGVHFTSQYWPTGMLWAKATRGQLQLRPLVTDPSEPMDQIWKKMNVEREEGEEDEEDENENWHHFGIPKGRKECEKWFYDSFPEVKNELKAWFKDAWAVNTQAVLFFFFRDYVPRWLRGICRWFLEKFLCIRVFQLAEITTLEYLKMRFPGKDRSSRICRDLCGFYSALVGRVDEAPALLSMSCMFHCLRGTTKGSIGKMYPVGGSSNMAKGMMKVIRSYGGEGYCHARVKRIVLDQTEKMVRGVEMVNGMFIPAETVMSCVGFANTFGELLPPHLAPRDLDVYARPGIHFVQVFLGFNREYTELGLPASDLILSTADLSETTKVMDQEIPNPEDQAMCYIGNPNALHPPAPGKSSLCLVIPSNWEHFARWKDTTINQRGSEYEDLKRSMCDYWLRVLFGRYPRMEDHLEIMKIGTPLSCKHWTAWPTGEAYGAVVGPRRFFDAYDECVIDVEKKIRGLIVSSSDSNIAPGIPAALFTGVQTAGRVLGRDLFLDMVNLVARRRVEEAESIHGNSIDFD